MYNLKREMSKPSKKDKWYARVIYIIISFYYYRWFGNIYPLDTLADLGLIILTVAFALLSTGILVAYLMGSYSQDDFDGTGQS